MNDSECPRWDIRNNISLVNDRLAKFGMLSVSFTQREREPILGTLIIEDFTPTGARFWFVESIRYMTIEFVNLLSSVIMTNSESLSHFLNRECPRWDLRNNIPIVNERLARFGTMSVSFYHFVQNGGSGNPRVPTLNNALDARFWYASVGDWITITDIA